MSRVTEKDTKKVILGYVAELEEKIALQKEGTFNPEIVRVEAVKKENTAKAEKIVELNILAPEIMDEYNGLKADIEAKKADLKTLYDIDVKAETLAALIEANNIEIEEARKAKDEIIEERKAELDELRVRYNKLEEELKNRYDEMDSNLDKLYDSKYADAKSKFERKLEENKYTLERQKVVDNDAWEDEKTKREAELSSREEAVAEREAVVSNSETEIESLKAQVEDMPEQIAKAKEEGYRDGEAKGKTSAAIEYSYKKKELELDKKLVDQENAQLKEALIKAEKEKEDMANKLEAAYEKINELAGKTVTASQPVYVNKGDK